MLQRARRAGIRPISIGRALLAQVDNQFDDLGGDGALIPHYLITLHPDNAKALRAFEAPLLEELHHAVSHHAALEGYALSSEVQVRLVSDPSVKRGTCKVASITDPIHGFDPPISQPIPIIESTTTTGATRVATIVLGSGERITLTGDLATVGRQSDCHIVIDDQNVSRVHAEIRRTPSGWMVTDRGSTNGTKVNDEKVVTGRLLANGDTIAFGSTPVRFENS